MAAGKREPSYRKYIVRIVQSVLILIPLFFNEINFLFICKLQYEF